MHFKFLKLGQAAKSKFPNAAPAANLLVTLTGRRLSLEPN